MSFAWFITLIAGVLATVGAGALFIGLLSTGERRTFMLRVMSYGLAGSGLVLLAGNLAGLVPDNDFFAGLLLLIFGTSVTTAPWKWSFQPKSGGEKPPAA